MATINDTQLRVSQKLERLNAPSDSLDSPSVVENKCSVSKRSLFQGKHHTNMPKGKPLSQALKLMPGFVFYFKSLQCGNKNKCTSKILKFLLLLFLKTKIVIRETFRQIIGYLITKM